MIVDTDCSHCGGLGEVNLTTPSVRARYVRHDDMDPGDYTGPCPMCEGTGVVESDPEDEIEDWMRP
jgi:hypothetical protein